VRGTWCLVRSGLWPIGKEEGGVGLNYSEKGVRGHRAIDRGLNENGECGIVPAANGARFLFDQQARGNRRQRKVQRLKIVEKGTLTCAGT